ncbi:C47 family peptidase, partial [Lactococcus formosensis subsp. bovis]
TPDESGITSQPDESVETPPAESHVTPPTNANYTQAENFKIRETQNQEPWCSQYTNAAAVNTTYKATDTAVTSAKEIMRLKNPGVSDEELLQTAGGTLENSVKVLQDSYQIATDIEMRTLSFAEVKQEIDAGGIIQIDMYDSESEEAIGTGDNLGHAVTIVGYVMPKEGNQAPYYIIWNPWWNSTFYLSSNAKTMNLAGTKYEWKRTWHNWRKTNGTRSARTLDPSIGDQKVSSAVNPYSLEKTNSKNLIDDTFFNKNVLDFGKNSDILNQNVSQFGAETQVEEVLSGSIFGYRYNYSFGDYDTRELLQIRWNENKKISKSYYETASRFKESVDAMNSAKNELKSSLGISGAMLIGLLTALFFQPAFPVAVMILEGLGLVGAGIDSIGIIRTAYSYLNNKEYVKQAYNDCVPIM